MKKDLKYKYHQNPSYKTTAKNINVIYPRAH